MAAKMGVLGLIYISVYISHDRQFTGLSYVSNQVEVHVLEKPI